MLEIIIAVLMVFAIGGLLNQQINVRLDRHIEKGKKYEPASGPVWRDEEKNDEG